MEMDFNIIDHHRRGPPIGIGALAAEKVCRGAMPLTDEETQTVAGGVVRWVYQEGRARNWW